MRKSSGVVNKDHPQCSLSPASNSGILDLASMLGTNGIIKQYNFIRITTTKLVKFMKNWNIMHPIPYETKIMASSMDWDSVLRSIIFRISKHRQNTRSLLNITFIFDRCRRSSPAVSPVKYVKCDSNNIRGTFARSVYFTDKLTNGDLVTLTPEQNVQHFCGWYFEMRFLVNIWILMIFSI